MLIDIIALVIVCLLALVIIVRQINGERRHCSQIADLQMRVQRNENWTAILRAQLDRHEVDFMTLPAAVKLNRELLDSLCDIFHMEAMDNGRIIRRPSGPYELPPALTERTALPAAVARAQPSSVRAAMDMESQFTGAGRVISTDAPLATELSELPPHLMGLTADQAAIAQGMLGRAESDAGLPSKDR